MVLAPRTLGLYKYLANSRLIRPTVPAPYHLGEPWWYGAFVFVTKGLRGVLASFPIGGLGGQLGSVGLEFQIWWYEWYELTSLSC